MGHQVFVKAVGEFFRKGRRGEGLHSAIKGPSGEEDLRWWRGDLYTETQVLDEELEHFRTGVSRQDRGASIVQLAPMAFSGVDMRQFIDISPDSAQSRESYEKFVEGKSPAEVRWWSKATVAVVTGANKGIGSDIVRQLAKAGVTTVLTARDESRGVAAVDKLKAEGLENVLFHPLDVTDAASAAKLANWLKEKFGGIDILVNNAAIASWHMDYDNAVATFSTNYYGQKMVTSALLPLLKPSPAGARIVFVSSGVPLDTWLKNEKAKVKEQLSDPEHLTEEAVDSISAEYLESNKKGEDCWTTGPPSHYMLSKILCNAYCRVLARSLSSRPSGSKVYVNAMSPGLVSTDLNHYVGGRTLEHGAETAVWLALFPSGGPHGGCFKDRADYAF